MKKTKVLIIVEGGIVQSVHADSDLEYVVVDYDKHSDDPVLIGGVNTPDTVLGPGEKFYNMYKPAKESTDRDEVFVHESLKKLKF